MSDTSSNAPTSERKLSIQESYRKEEALPRNDKDLWGFDSTPLALASGRTPTEDIVKLASQKLAFLKQAHEDHKEA